MLIKQDNGYSGVCVVQMRVSVLLIRFSMLGTKSLGMAVLILINASVFFAFTDLSRQEKQLSL